MHAFGTLLFDFAEDAEQKKPIQDPVIENRMLQHMIRLMEENDCPDEQFERLGIHR